MHYSNVDEAFSVTQLQRWYSLFKQPKTDFETELFENQEQHF